MHNDAGNAHILDTEKYMRYDYLYMLFPTGMIGKPD